MGGIIPQTFRHAGAEVIHSCGGNWYNSRMDCQAVYSHHIWVWVSIYLVRQYGQVPVVIIRALWRRSSVQIAPARMQRNSPFCLTSNPLPCNNAVMLSLHTPYWTPCMSSLRNAATRHCATRKASPPCVPSHSLFSITRMSTIKPHDISMVVGDRHFHLTCCSAFLSRLIGPDAFVVMILVSLHITPHYLYFGFVYN